ncbi:MAG: hypothetical protein WBW41_03460 [Verrucomicrobiia bacterium]
MKVRWPGFLICAILGLVMLVGGLLIPAYLRAVDASVIQKAGRNGPALLEQGQALAGAKKLGAAKMLMRAARAAGIPGWDRLGETVTNQARQYPDALAWGDDSPMENLFGGNAKAPEAGAEPFTDFIIHQENREAALAHLRVSSSSVVMELLRTRALNNTILFPPSSSASGQAFDVALLECGLLLDGGHLTAGMSDAIFLSASAANRGGNSEPLEQVLMDFLSLGDRLNWDQLVAFVAQIQDTGTLHQLAGQVRNAGEQLPVLFAAVQLSGKPAAVAKYLAKFSQSGLEDLRASLHDGAGGVSELAQRGQRLFNSDLERRVTAFDPFGAFFYFAAGCAFQTPWLALTLKWLCYLLGGFFLAGAFHFARPAVSFLERPLQVRGFHLVREFLFSLGFLLVVLLLSEPFLARESQKGGFSFRLQLPMAGGAVPVGIAGIKQTIMNPTIILTLLVFFVLQALLYMACLVKLAEIRRQRVPPRMKLKLLENEDHLFDAGLYLGFVGTIISLIIFSMGLVKFSLMAAYSSTSFGIIFVVIFKIFNLRPARRKLLLEAEAGAADTAGAPASMPTPVLPS